MRSTEPPHTLQEPPAAPGEDRPPLGSWRRLYTAVLVNAVLLILLAVLFSRWPF